MSDSLPVGIYRPKKSPYWWYRVGRKIRRSSRSTDIQEAIAQRQIALGNRARIMCSTEWLAWIAEQQRDSNSWLRRTYSHMRRKTRLRKWGGCITLEEFVHLIKRSNGLCQVTGLPFSRIPRPRDPMSISVDRIDCSKGYVTGNVRLVLLAVNIAMSHWGEDTLRKIARAVVGRELLAHTSEAGGNG